MSAGNSGNLNAKVKLNHPRKLIPGSIPNDEDGPSSNVMKTGGVSDFF